jgi:hypothetical protein
VSKGNKRKTYKEEAGGHKEEAGGHDEAPSSLSSEPAAGQGKRATASCLRQGPTALLSLRHNKKIFLHHVG